jgi:hypothetical protein
VTLAFYPSLNRLSNVQHLTLGSGGASLSGDANGAMTADTADTATNIWRVGRGKALGQPNGVITTATSGAGGLTGTYKYAYTETDGSGETVISAQATQVAASNTIQVTMPLPRKGVSSRKLYRTAAGGSTFKLVHDFGGGNGYYQVIWLDNTADGSLGAAAPSSDTSAVYEQEVTATVSFWRAHPDAGTNPSDVTYLRADNQNAGGSLNIDSYGTIYCRQSLSDAYGSLMTGVTGHHFQGYWLGTTDDGVSPVSVFHVYPRGEVKIAPPTLTDFGAGGNYPFEVITTMPTTVTATVQCVHFQLTGAGTSSQNVRAVTTDLMAGYTGSGQTAAIYGSNAGASTGGNHGVYGRATAGGAQNVGVTGRAQGGTKNIGGAFLLNADPDGLNLSAALLASNGATTDPIVNFLDNTSSVFSIADGGNVTASGNYAIGTPSVSDSRMQLGNPAAGIKDRGDAAGGAVIRATSTSAGGNCLFFGHASTGYLCTLGAFSSAGTAFIGFYCYHGATADTQRYASGTNVPGLISFDDTGTLRFRTAAAGTVDTDITFVTRWSVSTAGAMTVNGTSALNGNVTMGEGNNLISGTTTGTKIGTATNQKLGLWNVTPVIQPASANQAALTDSTGGTADGTVADVGAAFSQTTLNNNFADIIRLVNQMRNDLVTIGALKGAA